MKKRLMSLLLVCSMILLLFTGLSVTALAAGTGPAGVPGPARRIPGFSLVTGVYFHTNLADEISTKVNLLSVGIYRSVTRSCGWRTM